MMAQPKTSSPILTEEHKQQYGTQGFVVFRQLFSPSEMADIEAAFTRVMGTAAAETGYDGTRSLNVYPITEGDVVFEQLIDDARINDIVEGLLGEDCLYHSSGGHIFASHSSWHCDAGVPGHPGAHMTFYLDPVKDKLGCLNVIPGSHHREYHDALARARISGFYDFNSPDLPGRYPLESDPGDVVVFRHELLHSAWGGKPGRRMFGLHYESNPTYSWQRYHLMGVNEAHLPYIKAGLRIYSDRLVETASPRRMKRLQKFIEMGYCDKARPPLTNLYYVYHGGKYGVPANEGWLSQRITSA